MNTHFWLWLKDFFQRRSQVSQALASLKELQTKYSSGGRRFTRDEMNER
jgi:hypothetical protein